MSFTVGDRLEEWAKYDSPIINERDQCAISVCQLGDGRFLFWHSGISWQGVRGCRFGPGLLARAGLLASYFKFSHHFFDINALRRKQVVQGFAGFFQGSDISVSVALRGDEVANRLAVPRDGHGCAGRDVFRQACAELLNTYFGRFHDFYPLVRHRKLVNPSVHNFAFSVVCQADVPLFSC